MAPTQITEDYYAILEISQTADLTGIKSSYRRLAKAKHPDKNCGNLNATAEFQLLQEAYSALCDPESRRSYDIQYASIMRARQTKPKTTTAETSSQRSSSGSKSTEEKDGAMKQRSELHQKKLQELNSRRTAQSNKISEEVGVLNKLQAELSKLQEEIEKADKEQAAELSWWGYLGSYITRKAQETEEEKEERDRRQLDRRAAQKIRERLLERQKTKVQNLETGLRATDGEIKRVQVEFWKAENDAQAARQREAAKKQAEAEQRRKAEAEQKRKAEAEQKRKAEEEQKRKAEEEQKRKAEEEQKRKAEAAQKWKAEQEKNRRESEARAAEARRIYLAEVEEQRRRQQAEAEENEKQRKRRVEEMLRARAQAQKAPSRSTPSMASCDHKAWWNQVEGSHLCSRCSTTTNRFAFQCPTCNKVACATCRDVLKGTRPGQSGPRNSRKRDGSYKRR